MVELDSKNEYTPTNKDWCCRLRPRMIELAGTSLVSSSGLEQPDRGQALRPRKGPPM